MQQEKSSIKKLHYQKLQPHRYLVFLKYLVKSLFKLRWINFWKNCWRL